MHTSANKQTDGYIGLAVLTMFAVAIIAGQVRGNASSTFSMEADLPTALELGVLIERDVPVGSDSGYEVIRKFKTMPNVVDFGVDILALPELTFSGQLSPRSARQRTIL